MMRRVMIAAFAAAALVACGRNTQTPQSGETPEAPPVIACNDVAIDPARAVSPTGMAAIAEIEIALLGGAVTPGTYDLVRAEPRDGAVSWPETRWQSVRVADSENGQVLDFALVRAAAGNEPERFTALLDDAGEQTTLTYTCGRTGHTRARFVAPGNELHLLLPAEGGAGQTFHVFVRRAG